MKKIPHLNYKTHAGKYLVIEKWEHSIPSGLKADSVTIQIGFTTNGASIPRVFWWILSPFNPRYMEETTVHDYLCDKKQYSRADTWFEQLLIENKDIRMWHRKVFIASVKSWHWLAYQPAEYFDAAQPRAWLKLFKKQ